MGSKLVSNCCQAELLTEHSDEGTSFYRCYKCLKPCDEFVEQPESFGSAQDKSGQCQCKCYKPKKGGCSYSCKKCTPEFGTLCVNNQEHLMRLVNEASEPVKQECKCDCHDDFCQCSCHDYGEEHSMCSNDAKSCTYSRGAKEGEGCEHCEPSLPIQPSAQGKQSEEGWEYDADYHKKLEKWHDRFFDTDRDVYFKIRDLIRQELSLSRQQERERIAKEIEYIITGLVERDYHEAGAFANKLCGEIEKKYLSEKLEQIK